MNAAGKYRHRLTWTKRRPATETVFGGTTPADDEARRVWAWIEETGSGEATRGGATAGQAQCRLHIRGFYSVRSKDRFTDGLGQLYEAVGPSFRGDNEVIVPCIRGTVPG